jgi:hypothetical protein
MGLHTLSLIRILDVSAAVFTRGGRKEFWHTPLTNKMLWYMEGT